MAARAFLYLTLFSVAVAMASSSGPLLAVNYSEWVNFPLDIVGAQIATDNAGALYLLSNVTPSTVTKLSADGKTIL
jgi:hypothetical protein